MPVNKTVFITGAAAGIGRATALNFARNGFTVGGYDIDEEGLKTLADEIVGLGGTAVTGHLDVTDPDEMAQRVGEFAKAAGDRLDVMINNAGILLAGRFEDIDSAAHLKVIDVNTKGVVNGLHAAFPYLRVDPEIRRRQPRVGVGHLRPGRARRSTARRSSSSAASPRRSNIEWSRYGIRVIDDVAALRADRDDRSHQDRHDRFAWHPVDRAGRRRRHRRGGRATPSCAAQSIRCTSRRKHRPRRLAMQSPSSRPPG